MADTDFCLKAIQISHGYGEQQVLHKLDFSLPKGSLCTLLGANGSGKSTLLKILAGHIIADHGNVDRHGRLGFVPQTVNAALSLSVLEMVLLGRSGSISLLRSPSKNDYQAAQDALARVEACHLAKRAYPSLSGGEQQLVLMARALAANADILLLDEPSAAMDWHNQALILKLLQELAADGMSILLSTHSPQHSLEFASHTLLLFEDGSYAFGRPELVMTEAALTQMYQLPVRRVSLDQLPRSGTAVPIFSAMNFKGF